MRSGLRLVRAEITKALRRPLHRGLLLALVGLGLVIALGVIHGARDPKHTMIRDFTTWPRVVPWSLQPLNLLLRPVTMLLAASIVGSEHALDTWKMLLPRRARRRDFLFAKWAVTALAGLVVFAVTEVATAGPVLLGSRALGIAPTGSGVAPTTGMLTAMLSAFYVELLVGMSFASAATVVTRSTFGGTLASLAAVFLLDLAGHGNPTVSLFIPSAHLANVRALVTQDEVLHARMVKVFDGTIGGLTSVIAVLAYLVAPLIFAVILHERRDVDGHAGGG